ncbi:OTU domain-containing protein 4 isoform 3-T4 [Fundulus diaphanus]
MDSGGNMQSREERSAEKLMDNYLKSIGFHRKKIAKDGSCLFRAVAEQVLHCQSLHTEVRAQCVEFLRRNRDSYEAFIEGDFEEYLGKLQDPQQWVGEVEINALAVMYKRDFLIFQEPGKPAVNITANNFKDEVRLCFLNGNHYDSVYPVSRIKNAALCQSVLYELLYEGVFKVDRHSLGPCQRVGRPMDLLSDDCMAFCASSDESDLENEEPLWVENGGVSSSPRPSSSYRGRGRGRALPERVRRSLNPTLLRNVDYDIWHKNKRAQQKMDYSIAAGMQFSAGDRCQVRLEKGRTYKATIREAAPENGRVTVYVEELGEKQVPLWSLRPINEENSWTTVTNRDKRLSNGHGDWEARGRGRGRGKSIPAAAAASSSSSSSSVSQAATVGSSGRVQKQHSWPPQATVEEQGGPKSSRKSLGAAEPYFGLTEKERLAKQEEEMNVALVEIQLRDEESFPALGSQAAAQAEAGRKKGADKRRPQRTKAKSPVEDVAAPSPSAGDRPTSSSPPPTAPPAPPLSAPPADKPAASSDPAGRSASNVNMAAAPGSASVLPPARAAEETRPDGESYTSAATVPLSPPPGIKPPAPSSASLFSFITPVLPAATSAPPSSSSPATSPPTFIAPIAPSPTAAQGFKRPFSPLTSLPRSPSPTSSSMVPPPVQVKQAAPAQTNALPKIEESLPGSQASQSETSVSQDPPRVAPEPTEAPVPQEEKVTQQEAQTQSQPSVPQNQAQTPKTEARASDHQPHADVAAEPQTLPQTEGSPLQSPPPEAPQSSQAPQSASTESREEPPPQRSDSPPAASLQQHPPNLPSLPNLPQLHPQFLHPHSIPGTVPLQQLSQLCQDPLYPGFPQGEKGEVAQIPSYSSSESGDDLPKEVNILRFFFNLGVKAYSMPMFAPYMYLFPLQQYYTIQLKPPTHPPSPHYPSPSPPAKLQEAYQPNPYPPPSASPQYDHQTPSAEPPRPTEPNFSQIPYQGVAQPPPQRMPWQQVPPPRNPPCTVGYPSPPPPYSNLAPSSQAYHPGQPPVHSVYPPAAAPYPAFSLRYQPSSAPEELQVSAMEQLQAANADHIHGHVRLLGPLETPPAASMANTSSGRSIVVTNNYAMKKEGGEGLTRTVLLVDPPLNNKPILAVVSDPDDASLRSGCNPGSPSTYRGARKHLTSTKPYVVPGAHEPGQLVYTAAAMGMPEPQSVACGTEDDYEADAFTMNYPGQRKPYRGRGGRGRSSYDPGRGGHRRRHGDPGAGMGAGTHYFSSSFRGRGRERGY